MNCGRTCTNGCDPCTAPTEIRRSLMVGITLSPEQVRAAPPEVRHWLEQQIAETLGFQRPTPAVETARHLVGCAPEALRAALGLIQHILPVASVFFELAREGQVMSQR